MIYPRQKLYDISFKNFLKEILKGTIYKQNKINFERSFANYIGVSSENVIALSRGRLALFLAVKAVITSEKNEIIMSPFTIFDLVNMVVVAGGIPKFIDPTNAPHISKNDIENQITNKTSMVLITHYHTTNQEISEISKFLKEKKIFLMEDCAISLGSFLKNKHVGSFGDFSLFSFGLFKFVSSYIGGAIYVKDLKIKSKIMIEIKQWKQISIFQLTKYFFRSLKFYILTTSSIFKNITFPIFRYGHLRDIKLIKNQAKNDPDIQVYSKINSLYQLLPTQFQKREWQRQIFKIDEYKNKRLLNAQKYYNGLKKNKYITIVKPNLETDTFLHYPIEVKQKSNFISYLMKNDIDVSPYYYRVCSDEKGFIKFFCDCPNLRSYEKKLVMLPTYPSLSSAYIDKIIKLINSYKLNKN
jgi:dTDP-4-amino-4,6-dideoxygalactose transaminase